MSETPTVRQLWLTWLTRLAMPILLPAARRQLREALPGETAAGHEQARTRFATLEALGRLLTGIAPWLESTAGEPAEQATRDNIRLLARQAIAGLVDPRSPDSGNFREGGQPVVNAAFLSHALLRAPRELFSRLEPAVQEPLLDALTQTRAMRPAFNNWLLFSAMTETALQRFGRWSDPMRIDFAVRQHEQWYKGDGVYGDGPHFHWDYYNSFVIHPMLVDVLDTLYERGVLDPPLEPLRVRARRRAVRYAAVLERLIGPDGTFPPLGRSITYRAGAFHLLAQMALQHSLPTGVHPAQVREALTAVLRRTLDAPGTFDPRGFLTIGLTGHQPGLGETYISTASQYLTSAALLPLGLPPHDPFWSDPPAPWTQQLLWAGHDLPADHAYDETQ